jgi:hypothetical protein
MSITVRVFAHKGLSAMPVQSQQYTTAMVAHLDQPYLASEVLTVGDADPVSTVEATAPQSTRVLYVQVEDGGRVYYEVNPPSRAVEASSVSPIGRGDFTLQWHPGWTLSVLEVA